MLGDSLNLGVIEGVLSKYYDIEENSQTPQLQLRALIGTPLEIVIINTAYFQKSQPEELLESNIPLCHRKCGTSGQA